MYSPFTNPCIKWPRLAIWRTGSMFFRKGKSKRSNLILNKYTPQCQWKLWQWDESTSLDLSVKTCIPRGEPQKVCSVLGCAPVLQRGRWFYWTTIKGWNSFFGHFPLKTFVSYFWLLVVSWAVLWNNLFYTITKVSYCFCNWENKTFNPVLEKDWVSPFGCCRQQFCNQGGCL